jgi:hypothetical protein
MSAEKKKIQFLISPEDANDLVQLQDEAGVGTLAEVMRHALSWYRWSLREVKKGSEIQVVDPNGQVKTVVFGGFGGYPSA